jgi:uncharacterized protein YkwD
VIQHDLARAGVAMGVFMTCACGARSYAPPLDSPDARSDDAGDAAPEDSGPRPWRYDDAGVGVEPDLTCTGLPLWARSDADRETDLLDVINEARASGSTTGAGICARMAAAPTLEMNPSVRCAARETALEISTAGRTSLTQGFGNGDAGWDLLRQWGLEPGIMGVLYAQAPTAEEAVAVWTASRDCDVVFFDGFTLFGGGVTADVWVAFATDPL